MSKARAGFTFIEMMVVMILIGVIATIVIPRFAHRTPGAEWPTILNELNNLVTFAQQEAMANQKIYRLTFSKNQQPHCSIIVEEENIDPENPNKKIYTPASSYAIEPHYDFHESIGLKALYNGKQKTLIEDEKGTAHCYLIPDGLAQEITLYLFHKNQPEEKGVTLTLQPFAGLFTLEEGYIKP